MRIIEIEEANNEYFEHVWDWALRYAFVNTMIETRVSESEKGMKQNNKKILGSGTVVNTKRFSMLNNFEAVKVFTNNRFCESVGCEWDEGEVKQIICMTIIKLSLQHTLKLLFFLCLFPSLSPWTAFCFLVVFFCVFACEKTSN